MRGLVVAAAVAFGFTGAATAHAEPATLAALAPASDVRKAIAIGPTGQLYEPDGKGEWVRKRAGGTAVEIIGATAIGGTVIVGAKGAPPFKLKGGSWSAVFLQPKAKAIVGTGSRVLAAVGKNVFTLDGAGVETEKLAPAPGKVTLLAGSGKRAVIVTNQGLHELQGQTWKPVKKAPKQIRALVSDRWALVDKGAFDLKTLKTVAWPAGVQIEAATSQGETLLVVASRAKQLELLTVTGSKLAREPIALASTGSATASAVVGVVADDDKRVVIALRDGTIILRSGATWTSTIVREELPAPKPGPPPAESHAP